MGIPPSLFYYAHAPYPWNKWQLATSPAVSAPSCHFPFHNSIFADLSTLYFQRPSSSSHLAFFSRRLALRFHAIEWQFATSPAESALSYHFPLHDIILADLSTLYYRQFFIDFASRSVSRGLFLPLRHPSVVPSSGTSMTSRVLSEALKSSFVPFMPLTGKQNPVTYDSNLKQLKCHSPALNHYHPPLPLSPSLPIPSFANRHTSTERTTGDTTMTKAPTGNAAAKHKNKRTYRSPPVSFPPAIGRVLVQFSSVGTYYLLHPRCRL